MDYSEYNNDSYVRDIVKSLNNKVKRVALYCRCSTDKEVQINAIEIQEQELKREAEGKGWLVVKVYKENISGTTEEHRLQYKAMLNEMSADIFDILMIKDTDRLMRDNYQWYKFIDTLTNNNKLLFVSMANKFYEPWNDELLYGIRMTQNSEFSRNMSRKIYRAHKTRQINKTSPNITVCPYGWNRIDKNTFEINEKEADYIRQAYELLRQGYGFYSIANIMKERGALGRHAGKPRKNKDGTVTISTGYIDAYVWRKILLSTRMYGTVIMNTTNSNFKRKGRMKLPEEEWIYYDNVLPAIVDKEYWDEIMCIYNERSDHTPPGKHRRNNDRIGIHTFSNKIYCGYCGNKYYRLNNYVDKNGKRHIRWICSLRLHLGSKDCKNTMIDENNLRELLSAEILKQNKELTQNIEELTEHVRVKLLKVMAEDEKDVDELEMLIERTNSKRKVLLEKLMNEVISNEEYKSGLSIIESTIENAETEILLIKSISKKYDSIEDRIKYLELHKVIQEVVLKNIESCITKITITGDDCECELDKEKLLKVYGASDLDTVDDEKLDGTLKLRFRYNKSTVYTRHRKAVTIGVVDCILKYKGMTVQEIADALNEKHSYVYTSILQLKSNGVLERTGQNWIINEGEWNKYKQNL